MKGRLSSTIAMLGIVNLVALFAVLFLAFGRYDGTLVNSSAVKAGVHQT